ncbi:MAG TPA: GNAT family N-acetyltransferase [Candidatus Saccharimonadales bacterium]|nr:GNAT family N-acetyltransferase [Candidatus Saccharimonadales bacterium]
MIDAHGLSPTLPKIIIDDGLLLRRITPDDAEDMFKIIQADSGIGRNVTWAGLVHSLDDAHKGIEQLLKEFKSPYVLQENGVTIGFAGTWGYPGKDHEVGFSYFLAKEKRGHGYVTRTVRKLMEAVRNDNPSVDTFIVNITDSNKASQAVAEKLGFKATDKLMKDRVLTEPTRRYERPAHE